MVDVVVALTVVVLVACDVVVLVVAVMVVVVMVVQPSQLHYTYKLTNPKPNETEQTRLG